MSPAITELLDEFRSTGWIVYLCNFKSKYDAWKSMELVERTKQLSFFLTRSTTRGYLCVMYNTLFPNFPFGLNSKFSFQTGLYQSISLERLFLVNLFEK